MLAATVRGGGGSGSTAALAAARTEEEQERRRASVIRYIFAQCPLAISDAFCSVMDMPGLRDRVMFLNSGPSHGAAGGAASSIQEISSCFKGRSSSNAATTPPAAAVTAAKKEMISLGPVVSSAHSWRSSSSLLCGVRDLGPSHQQRRGLTHRSLQW